MTFMDFPPPRHLSRSFFTLPHFHQYIKAYVDNYALSQDIHLNHIVLQVRYHPTERKFRVQVHDSLSSTVFTREYNYVVVANGRFSKPYIPQIPGKFEGEMIHSHSIRQFTPSLFRDKRIAIVGLSVSGIDVLLQALTHYGSLRSILVVCNTEFISSSRHILSLKERGAFEHKERIAEFAGGKRVAFTDGATREIDTIFFCTGYDYSFPFLEEGTVTRLGRKAHSKGFGPVYLRSVHVENPRLIFVGFTEWIAILINAIEWNAILAASIVMGRVKWSRERLRALYQEEVEEVRKYDPDLSSFHMCHPVHYDCFKHIQRFKEACGVDPSFNSAQEEALKQYMRRMAHARSLNLFTAKTISFRDIRVKSSDLCPKSPNFGPSPKL